MKILYIKIKILICFFTICCLLSANAQQKRLEFNIGFAPPLDAIHGGLNFHINRRVDVGLSIGIIPDKFDFNNFTNFGVEAKYKFGESKSLKTRVELDGRLRNVRIKTWYYGLRGNFIKNLKTLDTEKKYFYITPAIGRHCNINKSIGFNIDLGLSFTVDQSIFYSGNKICRNCFLEEHPQYPLLPTLRIQFFAKL